MAPLPDQNAQNDSPMEMSNPEKKGYWTKGTIAMTVVFGLLSLAVILALVAFLVFRRREKAKRASQADKRALLAHDDDKSSMFSRNRESSVTLYADHHSEAQQNNRASMETVSLMPMQPTPPPKVFRDEAADHNSAGSGVSALSTSSINTNAPTSNTLLSPISPSGNEGDLGNRPTRPRSTSSSSQKARYYDSTPTRTDLPPIPMIIRTPSDEHIGNHR